MKFLLMLILEICFVPKLYGQTSAAALFNPNVYRTRVDIKATRVSDVKLQNLYNDKFTIKVDRPINDENDYLDYRIVSVQEDGTLIIRVLPTVKTSENIVHRPAKPDTTISGSIVQRPAKPDTIIKEVRFTNDKQNVSDLDNAFQYYFSVSKTDIQPFSKTLLSSKIVGIPLIHPVKLRRSKGVEGTTLNTEFTLSYAFGLRLKLGKDPFRQNFVTLVPYGFGLGTAKYFTENPDKTITEKKDDVAVTYYQGGVLFTVRKVNFGLFAGYDAMISKKNNWFYQSQPWFSFGLGYKFKED